MKKVLLLSLMVIFAFSGSAFAAHILLSTQSTFNYSTSAAAQFIELDEASGNLWVAGGGVGLPDMAFVFDTNGVEKSFSPVTTAWNSLGAYTCLLQTSGIGIDRSVTPHIAYVVSDIGNGPSQFISKYNAASGAVQNGIDHLSGIPALLTRMADIQFDNAGRLFVTHKVGYTVWALNKNTGVSLSRDTLASADTCIYNGGPGSVRRGLGVSADGNTVYIANESARAIFKLTGVSSDLDGTKQVSYSMSTLVDYTPSISTALPAACEVDSNGNVYVSITNANRIDIFNAAGSLVETIQENAPLWDTFDLKPRGVAFGSANPATNKLWVARFVTVFKATAPTSGPIAVYNVPASISDWKDYSF